MLFHVIKSKDVKNWQWMCSFLDLCPDCFFRNIDSDPSPITQWIRNRGSGCAPILNSLLFPGQTSNFTVPLKVQVPVPNVIIHFHTKFVNFSAYYVRVCYNLAICPSSPTLTDRQFRNSLLHLPNLLILYVRSLFIFATIMCGKGLL